MSKIWNLFRNKFKQNKLIKNYYENFLFHPIKNLYADSFEKNCLLSYSVFPFKQREKRFIHPNFIENYTLAEELRRHRYNIDVYNNSYARDIDYSKYDLIIGEGIPISNYFINNGDKRADTIYYATGTHPLLNNFKAKSVLLKFAQKHKKYIEKSARIVPEIWSLGASLSDKYIILGNSITKKSFDEFSDSKYKYLLNPPFYASNIISDFTKKNSKEFLWFGSYSLIHKDLNTVLDVFLNHPELTLHICGRIDEEKEFIDVYKKKLFEASNIIVHGYININSDKFKKLMEICSYTILSSCAEGCSTAIATVMGNGGLIPIISKECGIDIKNGFYVRSADYESIENAVLTASNEKIENILEKSKTNIDFVNKEFSIDVFKKNVSKILDLLLR